MTCLYIFGPHFLLLASEMNKTMTVKIFEGIQPFFLDRIETLTSSFFL